MTTPSTDMRCFFFNDTATTEIYTLSLHDALPISELRPHLEWADIVVLQGHMLELAPALKQPSSRTIVVCDMYDPMHLELRSEEHTSELQSQSNLVCRLLLEKTTTTSHSNRLRHDT